MKKGEQSKYLDILQQWAGKLQLGYWHITLGFEDLGERTMGKLGDTMGVIKFSSIIVNSKFLKYFKSIIIHELLHIIMMRMSDMILSWLEEFVGDEKTRKVLVASYETVEDDIIDDLANILVKLEERK